MQEAGEVLLNLMRSHAAAYRAIKAMPGASVRLKHLCQARCGTPSYWLPSPTLTGHEKLVDSASQELAGLCSWTAAAWKHGPAPKQRP